MIEHTPDTLSIAGLERDIEHRFEGLRRLLEVTDRINPGVLLDEAFRQIDEICRTLIPYERIEFALIDSRGITLECRWENPAPAEAPPSPAYTEEAARSTLRALLEAADPQVIDDLAAAPPTPYADLMALRRAATAGMRSALICPLLVPGKPVGFAFFFSSQPGAFEARHTEILRHTAASLSTVIAKGGLYELVIRTQLESERLLRNVLPEAIVKRLKAGERVIADGIPAATVVFVDIVNFVKLSASMSPAAVVVVLNRVFSAFDALCEQYGVEKIKTIGDAYMLATGVPNPIRDHITVAAKIALDMLELGNRLGIREKSTLSFRIGIHTGPVVAGVIGTRKFSYDLWGDTVNIASRMEVNGLPGRIHVTRQVYDALKDTFELEERGIMHLKGIGAMETFFLNAPKPGSAYPSAARSLLRTKKAEFTEAELLRRAEDAARK
jgi:class 3 adenylate cyclase